MLKKLNQSTVGVPQRYPVKILQFGEGNFLRAFVDWMVDLLNENAGFGGVVQIVQPIAQGMGQKLTEQDGLFHVVLTGIRDGRSVNEVRLVRSVANVVNPYENYNDYLRAGENPDLRYVVSNTTEAGIAFSEDDRGPDSLPHSFPGKLTALLLHRYRFFGGDPAKALTILPCELIEKNGEALREAILRYIVHWKLEDDFRKWIVDDTVFCNTLVDRIVPGFPRDNIRDIWDKTGYEDDLVVKAETFHLWVIEPKADEAKVARLRNSLPFESAGLSVKFVDDLTPYRSRKVRILNGAHTAMVPVGYLRGLRTVKETIDDPFTGAFVRKAIAEEIIPTLDLPRQELERFAHDVIERFQNPFIRHELLSIALNSVSKFKVRVLPSILEYIRRTGDLPQRLIYSLAALILFYRGSWKGEPVPLNDTPAVLEFFRNAWSDPDDLSKVVQRVLSSEALWDSDLTQLNGLSRAIEKSLMEMLAEEKRVGKTG